MPAIVLQNVEILADENPTVYEALRNLVDQLNQTMPSILSGTDHPEFQSSSAAPANNGIPAAPGVLYIQRNSLSGPLAIHVKDSGYGPTGWAEIAAFGSVPPTAASGFQAVATPTTITFFYDGTNGSTILSVFRANGDKTQVPAGKTVVTGLLANTTYFFYPYFDERSASLLFVSTGVQASQPTGIPAIAFLVDNPNASQIARLTHHIPLTAGTPITVTTPNVGSSPSPVGGGFGGHGRTA
jgi:hypothetical protein